MRKTQWLDLDDTKFLLMGTAGNYQLNGVSTITNDTFGLTPVDYEINSRWSILGELRYSDLSDVELSGENNAKKVGIIFPFRPFFVM